MSEISSVETQSLQHTCTGKNTQKYRHSCTGNMNREKSEVTHSGQSEGRAPQHPGAKQRLSQRWGLPRKGCCVFTTYTGHLQCKELGFHQCYRLDLLCLL